MELEYALICDQAFLTKENKLCLIGIFETINAEKFPTTHNQFYVAGTIFPDKREFTIGIDVTNTQGSILDRKHERKVKLPDIGRQFNFIMDVLNAEFPRMGEYSVELVVDGKTIKRMPLTLGKIDS